MERYYFKDKTEFGRHYVSINGTKVTVIESSGNDCETDYILDREFNTLEEAIEYYKAQGGVIHVVGKDVYKS